MFNIGEMRDKIDFYVDKREEDNLQPILEPFLIGIYAKATKLLGRENIALNSTNNIVQINFIIRYRQDINEDMYIKYKDKYYNIVGYERLKKDNNFLLIVTTLKEGANNGV